MKQEREINLKKDSKITVSGPQTRRSMIARDQNPVPIYQPNIEDILALQLSDTLINTAYYLSVTSITVAIHKMCDPLQRVFMTRKSSAYQNIKIFANRLKIHQYIEEKKKFIENTISKTSSQLTQIDQLKQSKVEKRGKHITILTTNEQRIQKVKDIVFSRLQKMIKILTRKLIKQKLTAFLKIQTNNLLNETPKNSNKNEIQQTFQKYDQNYGHSRKFHRRSIDKQPIRKPTTQSSFSLNKNIPSLKNRLTSPIGKNNNIQTSKNIVYTNSKNSNLGMIDGKKASTCSQTQSNNSQNQHSPAKQSYVPNLSNNRTNNPLSLLQSSSSKYASNPNANIKNSGNRLNSNSQLQESKVSSFLLNGSFFAQGTKQRQLEILRNKYYKLVEQFKDFSERFLQVIKQQ